LRKIELLPSIYSKFEFKSKIIEVTQEYVETNLVGNKNFTFIDITDFDETLANTPTALQVSSFDFPEPRRQALLKPILEKITATTSRGFLGQLTSFPHRRSNRAGCEQAVQFIKRSVDSIIEKLPAERKSRFKVELIKIGGFIAESIIVTFSGSGPDKEEHVLFGAHQDDVGHNQAGADDDGSGTTCVFESFRVLAESSFNPSKTIAWLFYTAEESGLVASTQIAADWKRRGVKVISHLNYDMVGNHPQGQPLAGRRLTINTTPKITEYMFKLSKIYSTLDINQWAFNGGSDHIPWFRNGFESACLSERVFSPHYHGPNDKVANVNFDQIAEFSKLGASYLGEVA